MHALSILEVQELAAGITDGNFRQVSLSVSVSERIGCARSIGDVNAIRVAVPFDAIRESGRGCCSGQAIVFELVSADVTRLMERLQVSDRARRLEAHPSFRRFSVLTAGGLDVQRLIFVESGYYFSGCVLDQFGAFLSTLRSCTLVDELAVIVE